MQHSVQRVVDSWQVLYNFFHVTSVDEMNNTCTKAILFFLKHILALFNTLKALFQGNVEMLKIIQTRY